MFAHSGYELLIKRSTQLRTLRTTLRIREMGTLWLHDRWHYLGNLFRFAKEAYDAQIGLREIASQEAKTGCHVPIQVLQRELIKKHYEKPGMRSRFATRLLLGALGGCAAGNVAARIYKSPEEGPPIATHVSEQQRTPSRSENGPSMASSLVLLWEFSKRV